MSTAVVRGMPSTSKKTARAAPTIPLSRTRPHRAQNQQSKQDLLRQAHQRQSDRDTSVNPRYEFNATRDGPHAGDRQRISGNQEGPVQGGGQTNQTQSNRAENSIRQSESSTSAKSGVQQLRGGEQGIVQTKPNVSTLNKAQRGRNKTVRKVPDTKDGGNMRQPIRRNIRSGIFRHVRNTISRPQNAPTIKNAVHNRPSAQQSREQIRRPQSEV